MLSLLKQERQRNLVKELWLLQLGGVPGVLDYCQYGSRDTIAHLCTVLGCAGAIVAALNDHRRNTDGRQLVEGPVGSVRASRLDRGFL